MLRTWHIFSSKQITVHFTSKTLSVFAKMVRPDGITGILVSKGSEVEAIGQFNFFPNLGLLKKRQKMYHNYSSYNLCLPCQILTLAGPCWTHLLLIPGHVLFNNKMFTIRYCYSRNKWMWLKIMKILSIIERNTTKILVYFQNRTSALNRNKSFLLTSHNVKGNWHGKTCSSAHYVTYILVQWLYYEKLDHLNAS